MLLLSENFIITEGSAQSGRIVAQVPCVGVVTCDGCTVEAHWISAPKTLILTFEDSEQVQLMCGIPVDSGLTVNQLKSICTQLSLSTSGLKAELLARVQEATGD